MQSSLDKRICGELEDIPLESRPFRIIAEQLGVTEEEVLSKAREFIKRRYVRRFAVSLNHRKLGFYGNSMCMIKVPTEKIDEIGYKISKSNEVTHCFHRGGLEYNLYFMVHSKSIRESVSKAEKILSELGTKEYKILSSVKEYKKTSFSIQDDRMH